MILNCKQPLIDKNLTLAPTTRKYKFDPIQTLGNIPNSVSYRSSTLDKTTGRTRLGMLANINESLFPGRDFNEVLFANLSQKMTPQNKQLTSNTIEIRDQVFEQKETHNLVQRRRGLLNRTVVQPERQDNRKNLNLTAKIDKNKNYPIDSIKNDDQYKTNDSINGKLKLQSKTSRRPSNRMILASPNNYQVQSRNSNRSQCNNEIFLTNLRSQYNNTTTGNQSKNDFAFSERSDLNLNPALKVQDIIHFSDSQLKYSDVLSLYNPLKSHGRQNFSLTQNKTIQNMKKVGRFPIPEHLLDPPPDYEPHIDSLINSAYNSDENEKWANYPRDIDAPNASPCSMETFSLFSQSNSEKSLDQGQALQTNFQQQDLKVPQDIQIEEEIKSRLNIDMKINRVIEELKDIKTFPERIYIAGIPLYMLKGNTLEDIIIKSASIFNEIDNEQISSDNDNDDISSDYGDIEPARLGLILDKDQIQDIFEFYCQEFKVPPISLMSYYHNQMLIFQNYFLSGNLIKAISCTIPFIRDLKGIDFLNNQINDECASVLLLSLSQLPLFSTFIQVQNSIKEEFMHTFKTLCQERDLKKQKQIDTLQRKLNYRQLKVLNLSRTSNMGVYIENLCHELHCMTKLEDLNLSQIPINADSCSHLRKILTDSLTLRYLDLSSCRITGQGSRYILEGLDRNRGGVRFFNYSFNDLSSNSYEFSIQIAKILSRNKHLMHLDISCTGLRKEEIMFVCVGMCYSRQMVSLHFSGNDVNYYDRQYIKTIMGATTKLYFKNTAHQPQIKTMKEYNQVLQLSQEQSQTNVIKDMISTRDNIEASSKVLMSQDILGLVQSFNLDSLFQVGKVTGMSNSNEKLMYAEALEKLKQRSEQLRELFNRDKVEIDPNSKIYEQISAVQNPQMLHLYNNEAAAHNRGYEPKSPSLNKLDNNGSSKEQWKLMKRLKAENQEKRFNYKESSGVLGSQSTKPLTLLDQMGIEKVGLDINYENPSSGYMKEVILTRIIGHDDIEGGEQWSDTNQCWICDKWNKVVIRYGETDQLVIIDNVNKMQELSKQLMKCIEMELLTENFNLQEGKLQSNNIHQTQKDIDIKLDKHDIPNDQNQDMIKSRDLQKKNEIFDDTMYKQVKGYSGLSSFKLDKSQIAKIICPSNFTKITGFKTKDAVKTGDSINYEIYKDCTLKAIPLDKQKDQLQENFKSNDILIQRQIIQKAPIGQKNQQEIPLDIFSIDMASGANSTQQASKRSPNAQDKTNKKLKVNLKADNFQKIKIEMNASLTSSLSNKVNEENKRTDEDYKEDSRIYLIASFNQWLPVEMKSLDQLRQAADGFDGKSKLGGISNVDNKSKSFSSIDPLSSEDDMLRYANYVAPGLHYFYFIKNNNFIFLSPRYEIVKFKSTRLLINCIRVLPRNGQLELLEIKKSLFEGVDQRFVKDRSVFKLWKDETDEMLRKMFENDIQYSKMHRVLKNNDEEMVEVKAAIFQYYKQLKNIFIHFASISTYPVISWNDFTNMCQKCKIIDKNINLSTIDRVFITTNVALHKLSSSAERSLQRYEFIEIIVRLANVKFKDTNVCLTTVEAVKKLITEHILPNTESKGGYEFREMELYTYDVNELLRRNEFPIKKIFEIYTHPNKKFITLKECQELIIKKGELKMLESTIGYCFALSLMIIIDPLIDQTRPNQMKYVEFLEFLGRVAYEYYRDGAYQDEPLHLKIDKILIPLFKNCNCVKQFSYLEQQNTGQYMNDKKSSYTPSARGDYDDDPKQGGGSRGGANSYARASYMDGDDYDGSLSVYSRYN